MSAAEAYIATLFEDVRARAADANRSDGSADYQAGRLSALQEVLSMMQNRATVFELALEPLGMAGFDPFTDRLDVSELPFTHFRCVCCGCRTLEGPPPGTHEICQVCGWEDDLGQAKDPSFRGGANEESLAEARASYARIGASSERSLPAVRPPRPDELPRPQR